MDGITWSPGIGDPTIFGWLTVLEYAVTTWLCSRAFLAEKAGPPRPLFASVRAWIRVARKHAPHLPPIARRAGLWLALSLIVLLLGINKQLDLQTLFTQVGRVTARLLGIYSMRRLLQVAFLFVLVIAALAAMRTARRILSQHPEFRLPFTGLVCLTTFVVARAVSFHGIDQRLGETVFGLSFNFLFESTGIVLIAVGAVRRIAILRSERRAGPRVS